MESLSDFLELREKLYNFLLEDIGTGDITSNSIISEKCKSKAEIVCKPKESFAILCGIDEIITVFEICNCKTRKIVDDGTKIKQKRKVLEIEGKTRDILKSERTALNLIMRMSGIATETRKYVEIICSKYPNVKISATRKTAPGLRTLDKKAVIVGGGIPHRMRLDEMVLIKDNHLKVTKSVKKSILKARKNSGSAIKIECEVTNLDEAVEAINAGADFVMLDNFSHSEAQRTINHLQKLGIRNKSKIEISGGITLENLEDYAKAGPDIISVGGITHSPKSIDFSLEII